MRGAHQVTRPPISVSARTALSIFADSASMFVGNHSAAHEQKLDLSEAHQSLVGGVLVPLAAARARAAAFHRRSTPRARASRCLPTGGLVEKALVPIRSHATLPVVANDSPERPAVSSPIAQHFSLLAKTYGDGAYYTRRRIAGLAAIAPELEAAGSILDLGCGNGAYLRDLAGAGGRDAGPSQAAFPASSECVSAFDLISTPWVVKMSQKPSLPQSLQPVQLVLTGNRSSTT